MDRGTDERKKRHGGNTQKDAERIPEKDRPGEWGGEQKNRRGRRKPKGERRRQMGSWKEKHR